MSKSNIFIFHGTEGYPQENWFPWLKKQAAAQGCKVLVPQFPSPAGEPAAVSAWFEVFKDYEQSINEDTILVGHSLGGIFALRLLEHIQYPIKAAFFVGTPVGVRPILNYDRDNSFSGFNFDWPTIKNKAKHFVVFQSDNDPYVSLGNGEELAKQLGTYMTFIPNAGHFNTRAGFLKFNQLWEKLQPVTE